MLVWWLSWCLAQDAGTETSEEPEAPSEAAGAPSEEAEAPSEEAEAPSEEAEEAPEPEVLLIPAYNLSAGLTTLESAKTDDDTTLEDVLGEEAMARLEGIDWEAPTALVRGRWYARPVLSLDGLDHGDTSPFAVRGGIALGRMWFTTGALPLQAGADVGVRATAPVGRATGYRVEAHGLVGPWLGSVGLRVGPTVRADRTAWRPKGEELLLDDAVLVGGRTVVAFDLGSVSPYVDVEPAWAVAGTRQAAASPALLPTLGTETRYGFGVTLQGPAHLGRSLSLERDPGGRHRRARHVLRVPSPQHLGWR